MQLLTADRSDYPDHHIYCGKPALGLPETFADDPLDPIPRARTGDGLFSHDEAQPGVLHSIENDVET